MEEETQPEPQPEATQPPVLRDHQLARLWTDEKGVICLDVDIPEGASATLNGDIVAFAYLVGDLIGYLGSLQKTAAAIVMQRQGRLT